MYQQDYILRMIEMLGTLWRRLLQALRAVRPEEALTIAERAAGTVAETDLSLIDALTPASLVALLSAGGQLDAVKAVLLGRVLEQRAAALDALDRAPEADAQREKARALLGAAHAVAPEIVAQVDAALDGLSE